LHPLNDHSTCLWYSKRKCPSPLSGYAQTLHPNPSIPFLHYGSVREGSSCSAQSKFFSVLATQWLNQLPPEAGTPESLPIFRKHLKPYLYRDYFK
jgi:hypothetical protein